MSKATPKSRHTLFTIGHSTRTLEELLDMLHAHKVKAVADVRLIPKSRRLPHFNDENLAKELPRAKIEYHPFKSLGGRRRPDKNSINLAWRNASFRGYADFMQTPAFADALEDLMALARRTPTTTMCAEAVPWRCHRSLISDALLVRGWEVLDIMSATKASPHKLPNFAQVDGTTITYPAEADAHGLFTPEPAPGDLL
jgi:uncharacterized protein (DUF488 family)